IDKLEGSRDAGLAEAEISIRRQKFGFNELQEKRQRGAWRIFGEQFKETLMVVLIIAAALSAFLGDFKDATAIGVIVGLNALLGFHQENRAEKAMAALKKMAVPMVKIRRDGRVREIPARDLVPGDLIFLEAGNVVPADCRLIESANLRIQEAALTGESAAVDKEADFRAEHHLPLADRRNMAYLGTVVTYGRGLAVVTETGMATELGRVATLLQTVERELTPLQRRLNQMAKGLAGAALLIVGVIFALGLLRGERPQLMFLTAVSIAVAAVPEGLPAVVTIALALGAQRMLRKKALIRRLAAVETLGSVTVICSDKTGTLTENQMAVTALDTAGHLIELKERLRQNDCRIFIDGSGIVTSTDVQPPSLPLLLAGGALCNDAFLEAEPPLAGMESASLSCRILGDPTEGAFIAAAARLGLSKPDLDLLLPRVGEIPFDSDRKRMTTVHRISSSSEPAPQPTASTAALQMIHKWSLDLRRPFVAFTKGAVDSLLKETAKVWTEGRTEDFDEAWRDRILASHEALAAKGMRLLGVAFQPLESFEGNGSLEKNLVFVGMVGMMDPPRPEVREAVATCQTAGIRPVMITGDHPLTAQAIARELGIAKDGKILTGQDLDRLSAADLEREVEQVPVFARVSPEHKLRIVEALQKRGHIVAMTGDGVNDAPSLKKADIGVAMGISGTEVSKEAADMVLQDDNFSTIVAAVEEGRMIYDNLRKFIKYLLTTNSGEIWLMLAAPFLGMPLPLLPIQILWINLVTDGFPALALGLEPAERDAMRRPPYPPDEKFFGRGMGRHIIWVGILMGLISLGLGFAKWQGGNPQWQTLVFTILTFSQMAHVLAIRSDRDSLFTIGLLSNKPLLAAVLLTIGLQFMIIYIPLLQSFFHTQALSGEEILLCLGLSSLVFWAVEIEKAIIRRRREGR
ncbi:MAG: cation transport ATPase, partial [Deltaproteobacteria bacterium]|nr:cation transport ATPase [Deltaproteobacteria bacterium]